MTTWRISGVSGAIFDDFSTSCLATLDDDASGLLLIDDFFGVLRDFRPRSLSSLLVSESEDDDEDDDEDPDEDDESLLSLEDEDEYRERFFFECLLSDFSLLVLFLESSFE